MKVELESTTKMVTLIINGAEVPARIWVGKTANGIPCHAFITRIAVARKKDSLEFERDLEEQRAPSLEIQDIPPRLIL